MAMQGFNIGIGMLIQINGKDYYLRVVESSAVLGLSWGSSFSTGEAPFQPGEYLWGNMKVLERVRTQRNSTSL